MDLTKDEAMMLLIAMKIMNMVVKEICINGKTDRIILPRLEARMQNVFRRKR